MVLAEDLRVEVEQVSHVFVCHVLDGTADLLVESDDAADVVIRPLRDEARGMTTWLWSRTGAPRGMTIAKLRVTRKVPARLRVHLGRNWFTVLSGTIVLRLGERTILVRAREAAEFSTMEPHAFGVREEAAEILCILDDDGTRTTWGRAAPSPRPAPRKPDRPGAPPTGNRREAQDWPRLTAAVPRRERVRQAPRLRRFAARRFGCASCTDTTESCRR